jgi:lipopolysaccharide/colanic/teichoic acid biosynthesis glycosyltransferase
MTSGGFGVGRFVDAAGALAGLVAAVPVIAVAAALIRMEDRGPVLYRQERIGKDGKPFTLLKLRTMTVGAEHEGAGLLVSANDSRITKAGRWLRATSLDELPQLWNILRGDMALVGPRPTVRSQVDRYSQRQRRRLDVLPGLTGWAQVNGRNSLSWDERIEMDLWYVRHRTLFLDLWILALTPSALLARDSLYGPDGKTRDFTTTGGN